MTALPHRRRFRLRLLVAFLLLMSMAYARQLVSSPTAGQDFRAFYAAALVSAQGHNPYDWGVLGAAEQRLYNRPTHRAPGDSDYYDFQPYPEGPWLALALEPLTMLPWQTAYAIFAGLLLAALGGGAWLTFGEARLRPNLRPLAMVCVVLTPVAFLSLFQGQATPLVFFAFVAAWTLTRGGHPLTGGAALAAAVWIKPNLGIVFPLVLILASPQATRRLLLSFAVTSALAFALAMAAFGRGLLEWPRGLIQHWLAVQGVQPDIASIHSFYYPLLHGVPKTVALALVMLAGAAYALWAIRRTTGAWRALCLLLVWIAWLPFVHSYDTLVLLPVVAALLGPDLRGWANGAVERAVWAFMLFPLLYFVGLHLGPFNGFTAIPVVMLLIAWHGEIAGEAAPRSAQVAA